MKISGWTKRFRVLTLPTRELQHAQLFAFNNINDKVERGRNLQLDTVVTTITSV